MLDKYCIEIEKCAKWVFCHNKAVKLHMYIFFGCSFMDP